MRRTRIKGTKKHQPRNKPKAQYFHPIPIHEHTQEDTEPGYEEICNSTIQVCNTPTSDPLASPEWFENKDMVTDRGSACADSAETRTFEPLPVHTAGILDSNMNSCELAEFGQLIDRLI